MPQSSEVVTCRRCGKVGALFRFANGASCVVHSTETHWYAPILRKKRKPEKEKKDAPFRHAGRRVGKTVNNPKSRNKFDPCAVKCKAEVARHG